MSQVNLIEARGVSKIYQSKDGPVESLKPIDFAIKEGEFVSVVGPSGCGKSTLLKMVAGLLPISGGSLTLAGKPIKGPQKDVGIVFQSAVLLMDEPFGALDAMTREKMNLELQRIWMASKKTVMLITHSIPEAIFLSDRVIVMSERPGSIAAVYDIDLPRARTLDMMASPEFGAYTKLVRAHFFSQGILDH